MAVNGKAWLHGSATMPTRVPRNQTSALTGLPMITHANSATATTRGGGYGVVAGGDLLATTTGGLGYSIAAGRLILPGTFATAQGSYTGYNDAAVTGSVGARDASNPRIDYLAYKVRDTDEDATGAEDDSIVVIAGTPAASPAAPSEPSSLGSLLIISEVLVPSTANGGALTFTNRRMYANGLGGIQRVTSTTRPSGAAVWEGLHIDESDTDRLYRHNGTSFIPIAGAYRLDMTGTTASLGTGANGAVTFTSEGFDTDGFHTGSATTAVIPTGLDGMYVIGWRGGTGGTPVSAMSPVILKIDGVNTFFGYVVTGTGDMCASQAFPIGAGSTVGVSVTNNHSSALTYTISLTLVRVGA